MDVVDVDVEVQRVVGGGLTETVEDRDVLLSFPSAARAAPLLAARGATELRELLVARVVLFQPKFGKAPFLRQLKVRRPTHSYPETEARCRT